MKRAEASGKRPFGVLRLVLSVCLAGCLSGSLSGCAWLGPWLGGGSCVVVPVSSEALPSDLSLRARVKLSLVGTGREIALEVIAQVAAGELVVVGLSEAGPRLFSVRQRGREMAIEASARELEWIALRVMDLLHRALFSEPLKEKSGQPAAGDDSSVDPVTIQYLRRPSPTSHSAQFAVSAPTALPALTLRNSSCGYEAILVVLEQTGLGVDLALPPETAPSRIESIEPMEPRGSTR